jgi:hypothetical protein
MQAIYLGSIHEKTKITKKRDLLKLRTGGWNRHLLSAMGFATKLSAGKGYSADPPSLGNKKDIIISDEVVACRKVIGHEAHDK